MEATTMTSGPEHAPVAAGLEGVVVAETRLSHVDGAAGRLVLRGWSVEELAPRAGFEAALSLLVQGELAEGATLRALSGRLGEARARAFETLAPRDPALSFADGMDALRALVARARVDAPDPMTMAIELAAIVQVSAAAWQRVRAGGIPLAPDPERGHAEDYLRMATGVVPDADRVRALDRYLVTVSDHGMNASTFAARVVTSTGSDAVSAIVAAIGALKGPLHGGAPGPVLDMLDAVGTPANARAWLEAELAAGRRVMGMGHRVYRVRDPRAAVLEGGIEALERAGLASGRLALARAVEREARAILRERKPDRPLEANVEFYTAVLLDAVGLDRAAFAPTFAVGRVAGWAAHVIEQRETGRLIRPSSRYVGP